MNQLIIKPLIHLYLIGLNIFIIIFDKYAVIELLNRYDIEPSLVYKIYISAILCLVVLLNLHILKITMKYVTEFFKEIFKSI